MRFGACFLHCRSTVLQLGQSAAMVQGEKETLEGSGMPLPTGASSNATAEEEYQKWGNRLASRCSTSQSLPSCLASRRAWDFLGPAWRHRV